ncbi:MAG TPA: hypothetical protein VG897_03940 [Terriglobales bacterium]|nr:hypothetical protein [Terriglobales bacterium]
MYLLLAILYVLLLVMVILFLAGATRLANKAEAENRMMPPKKPALRKFYPRRHYRDAA